MTYVLNDIEVRLAPIDSGNRRAPDLSNVRASVMTVNVAVNH